MHRTIGFISKRFVQIRSGEGRKVLLTFLYFFLIITAYYVIKPVSRSLILGELGSHSVLYADLVCVLLMGPVVALFAHLVDRLEKPRLVSLSFWVIIAILAVFWGLLYFPFRWVAGAFYVWVAIFSVLVVTLFWLVANDLYRPREAKRLFGFIGSGGILGGIVGSSIAALGAQILGTQHLLLLSGCILAVSWAVVQELWKLAPDRAADPEHSHAHPGSFLQDLHGFTETIFSSRYLLLLIGIVALNKIIATLVYYQFNPFLEQQFPSADAKTTFISLFFGGMNVLAFIVQFFLTSWILCRWGLSVSLLVLPITVLGGCLGMVLYPVFWLAAVTELFDGSLNYSLQQTTKEVLYLPIDRSIRYKVKPFIDMVVFRFGKGIAAVLGLVLLDVFHAPPIVLSYVTIPLLLAWLAAAVYLRRDYVTMIRTLLQAKAVAQRTPAAVADSVSVGVFGESLKTTHFADPFGALTESQPAVRKLSLLDRFLRSAGVDIQAGKDLLSGLMVYESRSVSAVELGSEVENLKETICNPNESMAKRAQAIRLLGRLGTQVIVDDLFSIMVLERDALLRQELVRELVKLRLGGRPLEFPPRLTRRAIDGEVANYQRIAKVAAIYRYHQAGPVEADEPVLELLKALMQESVEQVFRLLMLMYRPEDIHLVYEQMQSSDSYLRSDAIELLDNLIDPTMRMSLLPILDEDVFLSVFQVQKLPPEEVSDAHLMRCREDAVAQHAPNRRASLEPQWCRFRSSESGDELG
ncbi:MAG: hypothetical protein HYY57_02020 [Candidatus Omnitrophica bacterium]|nr:hypothetical protein [Candidatus Omnitrophota bacterium]